MAALAAQKKSQSFFVSLFQELGVFSINKEPKMKAPFIARLEPVVGIIRIYSADAPPPANYVAALVMVGDQGTVELKGLATHKLELAHAMAVKELLRRSGYHTMWWTRRHPKTGEMRHVEVPTGLARDAPSVIRG